MPVFRPHGENIKIIKTDDGKKSGKNEEDQGNHGSEVGMSMVDCSSAQQKMFMAKNNGRCLLRGRRQPAGLVTFQGYQRSILHRALGNPHQILPSSQGNL